MIGPVRFRLQRIRDRRQYGPVWAGPGLARVTEPKSVRIDRVAKSRAYHVAHPNRSRRSQLIGTGPASVRCSSLWDRPGPRPDRLPGLGRTDPWITLDSDLHHVRSLTMDGLRSNALKPLQTFCLPHLARLLNLMTSDPTSHQIATTYSTFDGMDKEDNKDDKIKAHSVDLAFTALALKDSATSTNQGSPRNIRLFRMQWQVTAPCFSQVGKTAKDCRPSRSQ